MDDVSDRWTHTLCDPCWRDRQGDQIPYRLRDRFVEDCCSCGAPTGSGIFMRGDPDGLACAGVHVVDAE